MSQIRTYRDLEVWKKATDLVVEVYSLSKKLPSDERYGLTSQMQRAAVSIPANIAEGHERKHLGDYIHHLSIARGSLAELETHITIAVRLEYLNRDAAADIWNLAQDVGRMLNKLISSLRKKTET